MREGNRQRGSTEVVVIACLVLLLVGALGWIFWQNVMGKESNQQSGSSAVADKEAIPVTKYSNSAAGFQLDYPSSWKIETSTDSSSASVATLTRNVNHERKGVNDTGFDTIDISTQANDSPRSSQSGIAAINAWKALSKDKGVSKGYEQYKDSVLSQEVRKINGVSVSLYELSAQQPYYAAVFATKGYVSAISFYATKDKLDAGSLALIETIRLN